MISSDDWFTKALLTNSVNRNAALKESIGKALISQSDNSDSFENILNEIMIGKIQESLNKGAILPKTNPLAPIFTPRTQAISTTGSLQFQSIEPERLNQLLDGKLKGMANAFIQAGQHYNVNPALLASISMHETGNGRSNAAQTKNNIAGMMGKGGLKAYDSVEQSIWDMARNLKENYIAEGKNTISAIGAKYAPIGAENDPTNLNHYWVSGVSKYFNQISRA